MLTLRTNCHRIAAGEKVEVITRGGVYLILRAEEPSFRVPGQGWIVHLDNALAVYRNGRWILDCCLWPHHTLAEEIARKQNLYCN